MMERLNIWTTVFLTTERRNCVCEKRSETRQMKSFEQGESCLHEIFTLPTLRRFPVSGCALDQRRVRSDA